jgi:hypothetical protein
MADPTSPVPAGWPEEVRDAIAHFQNSRYLLEQLVPIVEQELRKIHPLSCQFDGIFARAAAAGGHDPMDADLDPLRKAIADAAGITALYDLADRLVKAGPDYCDCREHGCADLAGIPAERAD